MQRGASAARRRAIAAETVSILDQGWYTTPSGRRVELAGLRRAVDGTRLYDPGTLDEELAVVGALPAGSCPTKLTVTGETSLAAAGRLALAGDDVACLNFASAKSPGGGFRTGAEAQEESLARASGLYACLRRAPAFYAHHRAEPDLLYSDHVIHAPAVPVFRDDTGALLDRPYEVSFITSPAPNAGAIRRDQPHAAAAIPAVLRRRAAKILAVALRHRHPSLVLGAWGCGVFRNDPATVAEAFNHHLRPGGLFANRFEQVCFAIVDDTPRRATFTAFTQVLAGG